MINDPAPDDERNNCAPLQRRDCAIAGECEYNSFCLPPCAREVQADLEFTTHLLARQCDLAREAEARAMRAETAISVFCAEVCGPGSEADGRGTAPECENCPLGAVEKAEAEKEE